MVPRATTHEDRLHRRRPRRPVLRAADEEARPAPRHHRGRAQPALRHLRLGRGVLRRDDGQHAPVGPPRPPTRSSRRFNHWDDIELHFKGRTHPHAAATASSASAARSCSTSCRRAARRSASSSCSRPRSTPTPTSPTPTWSSPATASTRASAASTRDVFQPDIVTRPNRFIWLGTHKLYDAFTFAFEKTEHGWFQAHAYQFDDKHHDLHRRDARGGLEGARPRPGRQDAVDRLLREAVRRQPAGPPADDQRAPPARLGLAQLPARDLRAVVALQRPQPRGADGRRGAHRALLDRLGHQARDRGRDRADAPVQRARATRRERHRRACWRATRRAPRRRAAAAERRLERDGVVRGRAASATATSSSPSSSRTRCSRAASASPTRTCACATRPGSRATSAGSPSARGAAPAGERRPPPMFTPFTLRGVTLKNRVVVSPMAQYSLRSTACRTTTTWCTSARARWAAPGWCSPR